MKPMPKKDSGRAAAAPENLTELVQFRCPIELKRWAEFYAERVRYTNLTALLIAYLATEKLAFEKLLHERGSGDQTDEIMGLRSPLRPNAETPSTQSTPPVRSGVARG